MKRCEEMASKISLASIKEIRIPIASKLILGFLAIIAITSIVFSVAGIQLIGNRIVQAAQDTVRMDINSAREIYLSRLTHVNDVVRLTADRYRLKDAVLAGNIQPVVIELSQVAQKEKLDVLTVTDRSGRVLLRTSNLGRVGDDKSEDEIVGAVLERQEAVASTCIVSAQDLQLFQIHRDAQS
jgi:two-component system NtrC family sensor kinase